MKQGRAKQKEGRNAKKERNNMVRGKRRKKGRKSKR
jgi:hypothetical protein